MPPARSAPAIPIDRLSGREKVAILLVALGPEAAAAATRNMQAEELEAISLEVARLETVPLATAQAVLDEWRETQQAVASLNEGGLEYARELLEKSLGPQKAATVLKRIQNQLQDGAGLHNLRRADPQQLSALLRNEHPQAVALILAHLDPPQTAAIVKELPGELGGEVMLRIARMEKVLPEVMKVVERSFGNEAAISLSQDMSVSGGPASVAEVLNLVGGGLEQELLHGIASHDPELSDRIKDLMFVFDDIVRLDDRALQRLLREVETRELALALKAATDELKDRITTTMSQRALMSLEEEMELLGPVRVSEVQGAQSRIVKVVRSLEEAGEIVIAGGGDEILVA